MILAIAAGGAAGIIDVVLTLDALNGFVCTEVQALAAIFAKGFNITHLGLSRQTFGISAPLARKRTAL